MAGALGGRATIIAQLMIDLNLAPSPDNPVAVAVRCDCLQVNHVAIYIAFSTHCYCIYFILWCFYITGSGGLTFTCA